MGKGLPREVHELLRAYIPGHRNDETAAEVKRVLGIDMTPKQVYIYRKNYRINNGLPNGRSIKKIWPQHIIDWTRERAAERVISRMEMTERINEQFGTSYSYEQVVSMYKREKIHSDYDCRYKPGHVPHQNIGPAPEGFLKNQFKPGHVPHNAVPVGTILTKDDGYLWKKLQMNPPKWKQLHRLIWEEKHGPVPPGNIIIFLDGDKTNCIPENLAMISQRESSIMNHRELRTNDAALTETGIAIARIVAAMNDRREREKKNGKAKRNDAEAAE